MRHRWARAVSKHRCVRVLCVLHTEHLLANFDRINSLSNEKASVSENQKNGTTIFSFRGFPYREGCGIDCPTPFHRYCLQRYKAHAPIVV